jgi:hypothetical protein
VANVQFQFGFQPFGSVAGVQPNFGFRRRTIAYNYTTALFRGDPVTSHTDGTIIAINSGQTLPVAGIFWGCEYTTNSPLTALPIKSKYWPGVSLGASMSSATVTCFIIDDPDVLFLVASLGSTAAISTSNIMSNVQWNAGAGGNTATGISSYVIDDGNITDTATLPFKIMDLYSTFAPPGQNGADDTSKYNWAVVKMNYSDRAAGTYGASV